MPVFLGNIVSEKENQLREIMKAIRTIAIFTIFQSLN